MKNILISLFTIIIPHLLFSHNYKVIGYYPSWAIYRTPSFKPHMIDASLVTHINYAFAKVDSSGNILLVDPWADTDYRSNWNSEKPFWGNFEELQELKKQNPELKTLISIGGWTLSDSFSALASSSITRANFAQNALQFCRQYGFDGIDIDWEYPGFAEHSGRPEDKENYTLLLADLNSVLEPEQLLLTIAAPAGPWHYANIEVDKIHPYVSWINLMTYDLHGPWADPDNTVTNHQAALYSPAEANPTLCIDSAVQYYISQGVPSTKIVIGMPFYGRSFASSSGLYTAYTGPGSGTTQEKGVLFFYDIKQNLASNRFWDNKAKASYIFDPRTKEFVTYDDEKALKLKSHYIKDHSLGGAMVWELGQDVQPTWDALHAINDGLE
jgi:chitinase